MEIDTPATHSFRGEGLYYETGYGILGGGTGAAGHMTLVDADGNQEAAPKFGLESTGPVRFLTASPGGGGYGDPRTRDRAAVHRDLRDGLISAAVARDVYGLDDTAIEALEQPLG